VTVAAYLVGTRRQRVAIALQAILMHDPVGLLALGSAASVEDQCLLHAHQMRLRPVRHHISVFARRLPVASVCGSVRAHARRVLAVAQAEEIPFLLPHFGFLCIHHHRSCAMLHQFPLTLPIYPEFHSCKKIFRKMRNGIFLSTHQEGPRARIC
jgi:hypothetical protein